MVTDLTDENDQENAIISEHRRAHRNSRENKQQLLEKVYFPQMRAKLTKIRKECQTCKEQKYERHPNKPELQSTLPYTTHTTIPRANYSRRLLSQLQTSSPHSNR